MANYVFKDNSIIGNLEAETDIFLDQCFIQTPAYHTLSNFNENDSEFFKRIIVGRTGSGKTALLKKLIENSTITKNDVIEAEKTIFDHIRNNKFISNLTENDIDLKIFFKALWVHVILVKIIHILHGEAGLIDKITTALKKPKNIDKIKHYLETYENKFFDDEVLTEITNDFENGVTASLNIPSTAKIEGSLKNIEKTRIQSETNNYVNRELLQSQKSIINYLAENSISDKQKKIIINIDDLDKGWFQNENIHYDFISALLEAFKELLVIKSVKVLISIRTDILEGVYKNKLKQDEKDLSLILPIEWHRSDIREVLDKRISHLLKDQYVQRNPKLKDLFNFEINSQNADEYLLDRIMMRPRDAIDFVNLCFKKAKGATLLNLNHLIEAEESFYVSRKNALVKEWSGLYADISIYLDSISFIQNQIFILEELSEECLNNIENHIIDKINNESNEVVALFLKDSASSIEAFKLIISRWFEVGIIGIRKSDEINIYSNFEKKHLDITDYNKKFIIHPLFYRNSPVPIESKNLLMAEASA